MPRSLLATLVSGAKIGNSANVQLYVEENEIENDRNGAKASSIKGSLPSKVVLQQRLSYIKGYFPQRSSPIKGLLPSSELSLYA